MADNPVRICVACKQRDDHPRHVVVEGTTDVPWHMDCHAELTDCETCMGIVSGARGATGDKLRAHIMKPSGKGK